MRDRSTLVVFEARAGARRALAAAAALDGPLTVVALAPKDARTARCVVHTPELEQAVRASAERDLRDAREALGDEADRASFVVLQTRRDRDLGEWAAGAGHTIAFLGARRTLLGVRPRERRARSLARAGLEVRIVR